MAEPARPALANDDTAALIEAVHEGVAAADAGHTLRGGAPLAAVLWHPSGAASSALPVTLAAPALADLLRIRAHIGRDNPAAANRVAV